MHEDLFLVLCPPAFRSALSTWIPLAILVAMKLAPKLDSSRVLVALVAASVLVLALGLFGVFSTIGRSNIELPSEGSIQEILNDRPVPGGTPNGNTPTPAGPPPPTAVRMVIPRLYIDAPVVTLGLGADNYPEVPERPDQVAWYDFSPAPGQQSNAVFSGHVDWQTRGGLPIPGVFYRLRELQIGDEISVTLEDGAELRYRVSGNVATEYDDPNVVRSMQATSKDAITLITCGGSWVRDRREPNGGNYSHRIIVRAERAAGS